MLRYVFVKVICCCLFAFSKIHVITFFNLSMPFYVPFLPPTDGGGGGGGMGGG